MAMIRLIINPPLDDEALNQLFMSAWGDFEPRSFSPVLERSLVYIGAFDRERLIGFVNVAWDGGVHGFILDTTVHADYQRRGIGQELVERAIAAARAGGIEWLHVDYEPHLDVFYKGCGFKETTAGLMRLI